MFSWYIIDHYLPPMVMSQALLKTIMSPLALLSHITLTAENHIFTKYLNFKKSYKSVEFIHILFTVVVKIKDIPLSICVII